MILLSLIMIVRNEAVNLPGFLNHHADLFDEMIIVDTGSEDYTVPVIRRFGADCISHFWKDDFSLARNEGLNRAKGRWLMILDADERIATADFLTIRKFLRKAPVAVYLQKTINYFSGGGHLEWQPVRGKYPMEEEGQKGYFEARRAGLFPGGKGLSFSGRVHESILPSAEKLGLDKYLLDIPVHHFGYVLSEQINRDRQNRYRKLVSLKLADSPEDWPSMLEMASIFLENGEIKKAVELLVKLVEGPDAHPAVNRGRFLLGRIRGEEGQFQAAGLLLLKAREADPTFLFAWLEAVKIEAARGHWTDVSDLLRQAREHFPASEPLLMRENLMYLINTGQLRPASTVARELAEICPQWQEISALAQKLEKLS